jgi:hypothetical protein
MVLAGQELEIAQTIFKTAQDNRPHIKEKPLSSF